jgi:hypothetical protein
MSDYDRNYTQFPLREPGAVAQGGGLTVGAVIENRQRLIDLIDAATAHMSRRDALEMTLSFFPVDAVDAAAPAICAAAGITAPSNET